MDAQLSIAKAFTLPVFCADAKNPGKKASSGQGSSASSASTSGFGEGEGAWTQEGQSARLLLRVAPASRSLLVVALPLLPSGEKVTSEARDLAQR